MDSLSLDFLDGRRPLTLPKSAALKLPFVSVALEMQAEGTTPQRKLSEEGVFSQSEHSVASGSGLAAAAAPASSSRGSGSPYRTTTAGAHHAPVIITVPHVTREEFVLALNKVSESPLLTSEEERALAAKCDLELVDSADINFPTGRASIYHLLDYLGCDISAYKGFVEQLWWKTDGLRRWHFIALLFPPASRDRG